MSVREMTHVAAVAACVGAACAAALAGNGCGSSATVSSGGSQAAASTAPPTAAAPTGATGAAGAAAAPATTGARASTPTAATPPGQPPPAHPVPAAFRVAAGAPSDAEVRRELLQMYAIQRRQRQISLLSPAASSLLYLLPWNLEAKTDQVSVASVFRDYGLGLACGGVLGRHQLGVAHKTAPCGTKIAFTYAGRRIIVPVIDRGPYIAGREWDLTGATAEALGFPGLGQIAWSAVG